MNLELAWAAGFWDGEGSCSLVRSRGVPRWARLYISQKYYEQPIQRFHNAVGQQGRLTQRIRPNTTNIGTVYAWTAVKQSTVIEVMKLLWPYLCDAKKEQYLKCKNEQDRLTEERKGWRSRHITA